MKAKRLFDIVFALLVGVIVTVPLVFTAMVIRLSTNASVLYWSDRVGKDKVIFRMPKFRTMRADTPAMATHQMSDPDEYVTSVGKFLRKTSLDELPQLWSILIGDMSVVGPRPALYNQDDLIG